MKVENISAEELDNYVGRDDVVIVDVRSPEAYRRKHIEGAINITSDNIGRINDKKKIYVLYCDRGGSSMSSAMLLARRGFTVKSVVGGINSYRGRALSYD